MPIPSPTETVQIRFPRTHTHNFNLENHFDIGKLSVHGNTHKCVESNLATFHPELGVSMYVVLGG